MLKSLKTFEQQSGERNYPPPNALHTDTAQPLQSVVNGIEVQEVRRAVLKRGSASPRCVRDILRRDPFDGAAAEPRAPQKRLGPPAHHESPDAGRKTEHLVERKRDEVRLHLVQSKPAEA